MKNYTVDELIKAIDGSYGVISIIAKKLKCNWNTAKTYCNKYKDSKQALEDEEEKALDLAEKVLFESIRAGNSQDAKWLLATKGKRRGYSEKHEISTENDKPIKITFISE